MFKYNKAIKIDFEKALIAAVKKIFPNIRTFGCYFHYINSLIREARIKHIINTDLNHITKILLINLSKIPLNI